MKSKPDTIIFETTGREVYANNRIIGIDHAGRVSDGYDGGFIEYAYDEPVTKEERLELAMYMIARWTRYANGGGVDE
jgi:hypothetical protein